MEKKEIDQELLKLLDGTYQIESVLKSFSDDNLLFKRILKMVFFGKIHDYFGLDLKLSDSIESCFPRRWRLETIKEFELATNLDTPKTILSNQRSNILVASFIIPLLCFVFIFFYKVEYLFIPISLIGLGIYIFLATLPAIFIGLVFPRFFSPLDWPDINSIEDFLDYLVIRNWDKYRNDSFSKTIAELKKLNFPLV